MIFVDPKFVIVSVFLVIETVAIVKLIENIKINKEIKPIQLKKIIDLVDGVCAIQGKIVALESLLISPYRKKECVYYNFQVDQKMELSMSRGFGWWDNLIADEKFICIGIDDGTGIVEIDLRKAKFSIGDSFEFETGRFKFPNKYQQNIISKYTIKKRSFGLAFQMKFKETIIEEGTEIYMQAEANHSVDSRLVFKNAQNIIISKPGKNLLLAKYQTNIFLSALGIVGGVIFLVVSL